MNAAPATMEPEAGVSLIELIVYVLLAAIIASTGAMILINSWNTEKDVTTVTQATNRGQVMGSAIERAMRNALEARVTGSGTELWVRTSLGGTLTCQGFLLTPGQARMSLTAAGLPVASSNWTAWEQGIAKVGTTPFFVKVGDTVTYTFEIKTDSAPVRIAGEASAVNRDRGEHAMLVIDRIARRARTARPEDEKGAVLIAVVVVMLVGFIIASVVAASVLFTIQANVGNRSRTQAFIAAESGRDVAVASIAAGCSTTAFSGATDPVYTSTVYVTGGNQPARATDAGVTQGCPTSSTRYVVIRSTGKGTDGSTTTIDSIYPWQVTYSQQPGGVVTYFSGGFTAGVSHYTGDLVLRDGNWACNIGGILDGDLYVLEGTTTFSNNCKVNGDIWSNGNVSNNSQAVTVNGDITTNGLVDMTANGNTKIDGFISAKGNISLTDQGSSTASVTGSLTSRNAISVGADWTAPGTRTPNSPTDPVFEPTLAWLKAATKWIDLDNTGWGAKYTATDVCDLVRNNPSPTISTLLSTAGTRLVLDFTSCSGNGNGNGNDAIDLALANVTVRRDAVFIVKPSTTLSVNLSGTLDDGGATRQLLFIHSDATRNFTNGEPVPNCGNGNQKDTFDVSGTMDPDVRIMMYTPCGITGTATSSFSGQYYTNDTSTHVHSGATYTCQSMSWSPAFDQLGCKIKGAGGVAEGSLVQRLGELTYQTEF